MDSEIWFIKAKSSKIASTTEVMNTLMKQLFENYWFIFWSEFCHKNSRSYRLEVPPTNLAEYI